MAAPRNSTSSDRKHIVDAFDERIFSSSLPFHDYSGHPYLAQTRFDPIVSPGKVASHVHKFAGASTLDSTVTYQSLRDAKATTAEVVDDKSLYWQPSLYWKDGNEKLHLVSPAVGLTVYWFGECLKWTSWSLREMRLIWGGGAVAGRKTESETFTDIPGGLREPIPPVSLQHNYTNILTPNQE